MAIRTPIRSVGKSTIIYGVGNLLTKLAAFLLIPVYTRFLSLQEVGILALLEMMEMFLVILIPFGINNALWRFLSDGDLNNRKRIVISAFSGTVLLNAVILGFIAYFHEIPALFLGLDVKDFSLILIVLLNIFLAFGIRLLLALLQFDAKRFQYISLSVVQFLGLLFVTIILVVGQGLGLTGVLISKAIVYMVLFLFSGIVILKDNLVFPSLSIYLRLFKFAAPLIVLALVAPVLNVSDRIFLNLYVPLEDIGVYSIAYKFGMLINMFLVVPLQRGWMPMMYKLGIEEKSHEFYRDILFYYAVIGGFIFLFISLFADNIISWIATEEYLKGTIIIPIITLAYFFSGFRQFFMAGAAVSNKTPRLARAAFSTIIINILLNYLLIKQFGIMGAAWATVLSFLTLMSLVYLVSQKIVFINWNLTRLVKLLIIMFTSYFLADFLQSNYELLNILWGVTGILFYGILLLITGTISKREKDGLKYLITIVRGKY